MTRPWVREKPFRVSFGALDAADVNKSKRQKHFLPYLKNEFVPERVWIARNRVLLSPGGGAHFKKLV